MGLGDTASCCSQSDSLKFCTFCSQSQPRNLNEIINCVLLKTLKIVIFILVNLRLASLARLRRGRGKIELVPAAVGGWNLLC